MKACIHPDGCGKPARINGWCKAHYSRIVRTGKPGCAEVPKPKRTCLAENCGRIVDGLGGLGYCGKHYQRVRKHGNPETIEKGGSSLPFDKNPNWSTTPSYNAVHLRLQRILGSAKRHQCVDCSADAKEWSYDYTDKDELTDPQGAYSIKASHYYPRCIRCHRVFDLALLNGDRDHITD